MKIKNKYLSNLLKLMSSSVVAQLLLIISSPVLTRLYTPQDFGVFALFIGVVGILSTVTNLRYEQAIIIPNENYEASQLVYLSLLINIIISLLIFFTLTLFSREIFTFFNIESLINYYWLIPIAVFFIGCFQVFNYWLIRNKEFGKVAKIKIQQSAIIIIIQFVFYKIGAIALVLGHSLGQLLGVVKNGVIFFKSTKIDRKEIKKVANNYKKFPIYSTWSALLNSMGAQLPILMFTAYYNPAIAGIYMLTQRIIKGPLSIISQAVTQIFISNLRNEDEKIQFELLRINKFLTSLVLIPFAIIVVAGDKLFAFTFGSEWAEAGVAAAILSPWMFLVFICSPIAVIIEYKGKQKVFLAFQLILFLLRLLSLYVGYILFDNYLDTLKVFSLVSALLWFLLLTYIMKLCRIHFFGWIFDIVKKILVVTLFFYIFYIFKIEDSLNYWMLLIVVSMISMFCLYEKGLFKGEN